MTVAVVGVSDEHSIKSTRLRILLTMLCEDDPRTADISKELETIGQLISMNSKKFHRQSRTEKRNNSQGRTQGRHSREDEEDMLKLYMRCVVTINSLSLHALSNVDIAISLGVPTMIAIPLHLSVALIVLAISLK